MSEKSSPKKRVNTYFRQTAKAFKEARQTQVFSHINRNIPHTMYKFSKDVFRKNKIIMKNKFGKIAKIPKKT